MTYSAQDASAESLAGLGLMVTPAEGLEPGQGEEFTFEFAAADLGMPAGLCAGRLNCAARPMKVTRMEMHAKSPEMMSAVDGDVAILVAPPQEPKAGRLEGLRAIRLRRGQALVLAPGAWHWIPFPTGEAGVRIMVVFRSQTGEDDLSFCDLAETAAIDTRKEKGI